MFTGDISSALDIFKLNDVYKIVAWYDRIIWPYLSHVPCYIHAIFNCAILGIIVVESTDVIISACLLPVDSALQHLRQTDKLNHKMDCCGLEATDGLCWMVCKLTNTTFIMFCPVVNTSDL